MLNRQQKFKNRLKYTLLNTELRAQEEGFSRQKVSTLTGGNGHGNHKCHR